jgi:thiamine pyrophosphokinase
MTYKKNKILIITGGCIDDELLLSRCRNEKYMMVIAADHGLDAADRLKIPLDYIVGDFDSVDEFVLEKYRRNKIPIETFPTEKDKTDTQIAIEIAILHNAESIELIGGTGSRLDHTMANLHLLMLPLLQNIDACIIDSYNKIYLKKESFDIVKKSQYGNFVSLLPFSPSVIGLTLTGFKYPLQSVILSAGSSLGISNEIVAEEVFVTFEDGILAVFETKD